MASEFPSKVINKGPSWRGLASLKFLVIFGDSYSEVGYDYTKSSVPTYDQPLGIEFPGYTSAEADEPNWVGHLITNYSPSEDQLLVYDYAVGGARVQGVRNQIQVMFMMKIAEKPYWAPWTGADTLFITWVGINDSAWSSDPVDNVKMLFEAQESLYGNGARNFLFVNVPPIDRSPAKGRKHHYENWNKELNAAAERFATKHTDATVMIYSSWDTFTALLDEPEAHGFPPGDVRKAGGSIWLDHLHPTSKVHDFIARDMAAFLSAQPAFEGEKE